MPHPPPTAGVTVPALVGGPGTGEGRARELFRVQAVRADLRVVLDAGEGKRRSERQWHGTWLWSLQQSTGMAPNTLML